MRFSRLGSKGAKTVIRDTGQAGRAGGHLAHAPIRGLAAGDALEQLAQILIGIAALAAARARHYRDLPAEAGSTQPSSQAMKKIRSQAR